MDTMAAIAKGLANIGKPLKVFDWDRAARLIREAGATEASAGLGEDWEWTGGAILRDGRPVPAEDTYVYLGSVWATPELEIGDERVPCFVSRHDRPEWGPGTYWPASALDDPGREGAGAMTAHAIAFIVAGWAGCHCIAHVIAGRLRRWTH